MSLAEMAQAIPAAFLLPEEREPWPRLEAGRAEDGPGFGERLMATALETVRDYTGNEYKYGFVTDIEADTLPPGPERGRRPRSSRPRRTSRSGMLEWRLKAYRHWLTMKEPHWAERRTTRRSTTRPSATTRRRSRRSRSSSLDEVDPELLRDLREARHPAARAEDAGRRRGRRGVRPRLGRPPPSRRSWPKLGHHLLLVLRGGARASRAGAEVPRLGRAATRDNFFAALNSAVFTDGSFVLHPQGRALPDGAVDLLPHQRRRTPASSSAR